MRPQGGPISTSSPSRTRSPEPQVVGEALADDVRTATPPRGAVETVVASPPVARAMVETPPHVAEAMGASTGDFWATTSPTIIDVGPIRAVPGGAKDLVRDQPQIDLAPGGPETSGAQVPPLHPQAQGCHDEGLIGITPLGRRIGSTTMKIYRPRGPASSRSTMCSW
jgi:hypothetical protein